MEKLDEFCWFFEIYSLFRKSHIECVSKRNRSNKDDRKTYTFVTPVINLISQKSLKSL